MVGSGARGCQHGEQFGEDGVGETTVDPSGKPAHAVLDKSLANAVAMAFEKFSRRIDREVERGVEMTLLHQHRQAAGGQRRQGDRIDAAKDRIAAEAADFFLAQKIEQQRHQPMHAIRHQLDVLRLFQPCGQPTGGVDAFDPCGDFGGRKEVVGDEAAEGLPMRCFWRGMMAVWGIGMPKG